jgi:hypothetical protein
MARPPTRRVLTFVMLSMLLVAGCGAASTGPPTPAEAQSYLGRLVELAQAGDFAGLCSAAGDLNCVDHLDSAGRNAVPPDPPQVIASSEIPSSTVGSQQVIGGIVLTVCGLDGRQQPYRSQVLVFRNGTTLAAINPVYWDDISIVGGDPPMTAASPAAGAAGC